MAVGYYRAGDLAVTSETVTIGDTVLHLRNITSVTIGLHRDFNRDGVLGVGAFAAGFLAGVVGVAIIAEAQDHPSAELMRSIPGALLVLLALACVAFGIWLVRRKPRVMSALQIQTSAAFESQMILFATERDARTVRDAIHAAMLKLSSPGSSSRP